MCGCEVDALACFLSFRLLALTLLMDFSISGIRGSKGRLGLMQCKYNARCNARQVHKLNADYGVNGR